MPNPGTILLRLAYESEDEASLHVESFSISLITQQGSTSLMSFTLLPCPSINIQLLLLWNRKASLLNVSVGYAMRSFGPDGVGNLACLTIRSEVGASYSCRVAGLPCSRSRAIAHGAMEIPLLLDLQELHKEKTGYLAVYKIRLMGVETKRERISR